MSKSLRWKFVTIMLILILLLMTVVCVFLIQGVQRFYTDEFFKQMEAFFADGDTYTALRDTLGEENPADKLQALLDAYKGQLGIDTETRNYYILDGTTGALVARSDVRQSTPVEITPNILKALNGSTTFAGDSNASFMDVAVPIASDDGAVQYIIYIRDNKQTVHDLNGEIVTLIVEAVSIGLVISVALSFILSKTLLQPIIGMTKAAEALAGGDFSKKLTVESGDEIGILADTFNNMASQLKTTLEEIKKSETLRREFVANVSHELRTPLTSIRSYAETLTDSPDMPAEMESDFLHVILNESDRMTKIVQDLLELSRFDAGSSSFTFEEFSLERSVLNVYDAIALEAARRGHVVQLELNGQLPDITGDRARIEQVLINILTNALKYTPDGGTITVSSGQSESSIWVSIRDTGIGIPADDIPRIFDRFYRVDKARSRESGGTGLGLSIAREIVVRHGGDITIDSAAGHGTTVTVTLPIEGTSCEA
ncbi:ATP-binding protein [Oscillospiraceae bacterium WX1]